jgi:Xaa-Pro aminopeptidase
MKKSTGAQLFYGPPADEAEIRYYTGFVAPDAALVLRHGGTNHLVMNAMEEGRARRTARNAEIWTDARLGFSEKAPKRPADLAIALLRKLKVRRVQVTNEFPMVLADLLRAAGIRVEATKATHANARWVKNAWEIRQLECAQRATGGAMRRARAILREAVIRRDGRLVWEKSVLTSERLRAEIEQLLRRQGYLCEGSIVACGAAGADPHERGAGPLRAGELIVLDIFPRHRVTGYWGDMTRTVVKGVATEEQVRRYRAVCRAQVVALKAIRPGAAGATVHGAAAAVIEQAGFPRCRVKNREEGFIHGTGHGVGLQIHEAPRIPGRDIVLRAGHVVTVEPGVYAQKVGGVRMEDLVVVTRTGCRILANAPRALVIP